MPESQEMELRTAPAGGEIPARDSSCYFACFSFTADGFLTHNVRRIMGTLRHIGELRSQNGAAHIKDVLEGRVCSHM